jgi:hypothetical protein
LSSDIKKPLFKIFLLCGDIKDADFGRLLGAKNKTKKKQKRFENMRDKKNREKNPNFQSV